MAVPQSSICVLCRQAFVPGALEHLLPNALGWTLASRDVVCPTCNQSTSLADTALTDAVAAITTLIDPPGRRTKPGRIKPQGTSVPVTIGAGGIVELPPVYAVEDPEHGHTLMIDDDAFEAFKERTEAKGQSIEVVSRTAAVEINDSRIEVLSMNPSVVATLSKTALHLAAMTTPDWDGNGKLADILRGLALGKHVGWPMGIAAWDLDQAVLSDAPFYNALAVTSCPQTGSITVRVHVYGFIRIRFLVSTDYRGSRHETTTIVRSPMDGGQHRATSRCPHPLPRLWLRPWSPEFPVEAAVDYFNLHRGQLAPEGFVDRGPAVGFLEAVVANHHVAVPK